MNHILADALDAILEAFAGGDHGLADTIAAYTPEELEEALGGGDRTESLLEGDSQPPGPPPRPGLVWNGSTHRWRNPHTGEEHDHPKGDTGGSGAGARTPAADHAPPDTKALENAVNKKKLHSDVFIRSDAAGKDWVVKGRVGKAKQVANEATAAALAPIAGADVVPVHHVKLHGQDHAVLPMLSGYNDLSNMTEAKDKRAAIARVPKQQVDSHALFDYAIGAKDPNLGNYLLSEDGTNLVAIDKEQSLGMGHGDSTAFTTPDLLSFAVPSGRAAVDYVFDRGAVAKMAEAAGQMAAKLEASGRKRDAVGVRNRAAVLKQLAIGEAEPTAGELARLGEGAGKTATAGSGGFFGRIKSIFGGKK